ncbi:NosR/NirI family protein [Achromobacter sp. NFACC18-2]|uniref:NosR/NirI family protein n=1 Tax=Achromobacter sp. NFACC18-2 TaxID=1564112 RepID=UPI0008CB5EE2|nr:NosR/NirI family protein [Achromobacter sp. NFACC18-2]SEK04426.1 NosR/NirI family transcriptional regulator, nitrous oxide reductase regulator [Achromobacter sp. NFACC18-2]
MWLSCLAVAQDAQAQRLPEFLATTPIGEVFPGADRTGLVEGKPAAARVYAGNRQLGLVYLTTDVVNTRGYSSKPIDVLVGLAADGRIVGAKLVEHHEPIVLIGIPQSKVDHFIQGYVGLNFVDAPPRHGAPPPVDIVSGATVTLMVIGDTITRSAIAVARAHGIGKAGAPRQTAQPAAARVLDEDRNDVQSWQALLDAGAVKNLRLTPEDVNQAFLRSGRQDAAEHGEGGPDDTFIDLYAALVSAPSIGRSLLGENGWQRLKERLKPGQQAVLVAGNGLYSFKGSGYVRGGIFDRIEVVQDESAFRFRDRNHQRLADVSAAGAPALREVALFVVPEDAALDPVKPWRLQLMVQRVLSVSDKAFVTFDLPYELPAAYTRAVAAGPAPAQAAAADAPAAPPAAEAQAEAAPPALWKQIWQGKAGQISILTVALAVLVGIFFFQDQLTARPLLHDRLRLAFLAFALFWIGWYGQAQLSIVNVLTFFSALRTDFRWEYFLMDPLVFILWCATAISMVFWNRGAFCGWLCPFGALQELTNRIARRLGVRQLKIRHGVAQRLSTLKYVIFLLLFGFSLYDLAVAEQLAEVEPFKTAIILRFVRYWPFVLFAVALLAAGLFIERFFCRYLCPLGAALAIPARLRIFNWLKRYRDCGNPCQRCNIECPVQAIHPSGEINPNECIQCLHCQMLYHHQEKCPHLIQKRSRRERRPAPPPEPAVQEVVLHRMPSLTPANRPNPES